MTVSINAVFPMAAPAASAQGAAQPAGKTGGAAGGKSSSFGAMVDGTADHRQQPASHEAKDGSSAVGNAIVPNDAAAGGLSSPAQSAQGVAEAAVDVLVTGQAAAPVDPQLADAAETAGMDGAPDPAQLAGQEQPAAQVTDQALGSGIHKSADLASHLASGKPLAANRAGAGGLVRTDESGEMVSAPSDDSSAPEPVGAGDAPEPGKHDSRTHAAADEQVLLQPDSALAQSAPSAATQAALASAVASADGNAQASAAAGVAAGDNRQLEGGSAITLASATTAHGSVGKSAAFGTQAQDTPSSAEAGRTSVASGDSAVTSGLGTSASDGGAGHADGTTLSNAVLTQTFATAASRPAALPYPASTQAAPQSPSVSVQEGRFGTDIGVQIARALDKGSDDLLIKLDPRHLGRIDVRLSFDHDGVLRAVMSAESSTAADMLRRESTDLNRALADAGIRADGQSLRFDTRAGGQGAGQGNGQNAGQGGQRWQGQQAQADDSFGGGDAPLYRSLRSSGHVDLMA